MYFRVYHPETEEAFDVPRWKADELLLKHGWRQTKIDKTGTPFVQEVEIADHDAEDFVDLPE